MSLSRISIAHVVMVCAEAFGVTREAIVGRRNSAPVIAARQAAYLLAIGAAGHESTVTGRHIGGRDHTTVLHGARAAEVRRALDPGFAACLQAAEIALAVLERTQLIDRIRAVDPVAAARRIVANPTREASAATALEVAAMAALIVETMTDPDEPEPEAVETTHAA